MKRRVIIRRKLELKFCFSGTAWCMYKYLSFSTTVLLSLPHQSTVPDILPLQVFIQTIFFNMRLGPAALLPALAFASPANFHARQTAPSPNQIQILSSSTSGNGCPQGSVSTTLSPDATVSLPSIQVLRNSILTVVTVGGNFRLWQFPSIHWTHSCSGGQDQAMPNPP